MRDPVRQPGSVPIRLRGCALILLLALGISGALCERDYGIYRAATLSDMPDLGCVRSVLDATETISSLDENHWVDEQEPVREPRRQHHRYSYEGPDVRGHLAISVDPDGQVRFVQAYVLVDQKPPQATVDRSLEVMRETAHAIEKQCGVEGLVASIHESCERVECKPDERQRG